MTTKAQIENSVQEVEVLCELAHRAILSDMPIAFGPPWTSEQERILKQLREIPDRYAELVRLAQKKHYWAIR